VLLGVLTRERGRRRRNLKGLLTPALFLFGVKTKKISNMLYTPWKRKTELRRSVNRI